jgi:putative transcriptional regulator
MLNENLRNLRRAKGLSQEELAIRVHVVRQTISKWEQGLSVPDSALLISLAEELDTSVSVLLGETIREDGLKDGDWARLSEKLEEINLQLAKRSRTRLRTIRCLLLAVCGIVIAGLAAFAAMNGEYLTWDLQDPELAVAGTLLHGFEFLFVRSAPFLLAGSLIALLCTYRKR